MTPIDEKKVRDLLRAVPGPEAQLVVEPNAIDNLRQLSNDLCVTIRVSRDVPPGTIYAMTPEEAAKVGCDYVVEPD